MKHRLRGPFRPLIPVNNEKKTRLKRPRRKHPAAVQFLNCYKGTMDELEPGFKCENNCGWCGKSLARVKIIHECTYDGFSHCSEKCCDKMDNWLMDNLIDPEGEIHDLTGLKEEGD